jgi:hypothetical protein
MLILFKANLMVRGWQNGEQPELRFIMTSKVISGADILDGSLKLKDIINDNLELYKNEIQIQLSTFFITEAISNVYLDAVQSIFSNYPTLQPKISQLNVLPVQTTVH